MLKVEKYGGSSVSTLKKIKLIAKHIKQTVEQNNKLVVVVSAMGKTTNKLISLSEKICKNPSKKEQDVLLCTGEMKTIALLTLALQNKNVKATCLCGFQANIKTSANFGKAIIKSINPNKIKKLLKTFDVVVVAGFQGICANQNLTTLGRGGSDTTAVALAAALHCPCTICTDVSHVFMANPSIIKLPKPLKKIDINSMLEIASSGAKVLDTRCLEIAKKFNVLVELKKSLSTEKGSQICMQKNFEEPKVLSICEKDDLTIFEAQNAEKHISKIFDVLKNENENLFLFQQLNEKICFAVAKNNTKKIEFLIKNISKNIKLQIFENICCVSVVGFGFSSHPQIADKIFKVLFKNKIFPKQTILSETKISITLNSKEKENAVQILAKLFKVSK